MAGSRLSDTVMLETKEEVGGVINTVYQVPGGGGVSK
jgi:hypothetical protein